MTGAVTADPGAGSPPVIVSAAVLRDGRLLSARRVSPPDLAGCWEFPGGKVEPGESDRQALVRECSEELGLAVTVEERIGPDVVLASGSVLRLFRCTTGEGEPRLRVHDRIRWLSPEELFDVPWITADLGLVEAVRPLLAG